MTAAGLQRKLAEHYSFGIQSQCGCRSRMSQAESLKEAIGLLKVVFGLLVAVDISLIAWLVQNYGTAQATLLGLAWAATILTVIVTIWVYVAAWRCIRNLKDA